MRGAAEAAGGMFGETAPSISGTIQQGTRQQSTAPAETTKVTGKESSSVSGGGGVGNVYLDGQKVGAIIFNKYNQIPGLDKA